MVILEKSSKFLFNQEFLYSLLELLISFSFAIDIPHPSIMASSFGPAVQCPRHPALEPHTLVAYLPTPCRGLAGPLVPQPRCPRPRYCSPDGAPNLMLLPPWMGAKGGDWEEGAHTSMERGKERKEEKRKVLDIKSVI